MLVDELNRALEQLLGRSEGPLHLRLWIQPIISTSIAILAGLRDARQNKPPFLWEILRNSVQRPVLIKTAWKDTGRLMITAFVIDFLYQLIILKSFYFLQALIVTFTLALLPYVILRGLVTRLRYYYSKRF